MKQFTIFEVRSTERKRVCDQLLNHVRMREIEHARSDLMTPDLPCQSQSSRQLVPSARQPVAYPVAVRNPAMRSSAKIAPLPYRAPLSITVRRPSLRPHRDSGPASQLHPGGNDGQEGVGRKDPCDGQGLLGHRNDGADGGGGSKLSTAEAAS